MTNDGGRAYICTTAGTSAGSGGPTGEGNDITDGTVHWCWLGSDVPIGVRDQADFQTTRISVHGTPVAP